MIVFTHGNKERQLGGGGLGPGVQISKGAQKPYGAPDDRSPSRMTDRSERQCLEIGMRAD